MLHRGFSDKWVCVIKWWRVKLGNNFTRVLSKLKTIDWEMAYKASKLIIFQFKLLHWPALATNDCLNITDIRENDICTFCRTEKESLFHLFWSCSQMSCFLQGFMEWLAENQITKIQHFHSRYNTELAWGRTPYPDTKQCNTFTSSDITCGPGKQRKYSKKYKDFPVFYLL